MELAVAKAVEKFGGLDILVANAGVELFGSAIDVGLKDWRRTFETNVDGAMFAARFAVPRMRERGGGAIVLVSSVAGLTGAPAYVSYLTTKAALLGLNRSLAYDFGGDGIRSNVLCPGWVRTEMAERALADVAAAKGTDLETMVKRVVKPYPLKRMAAPEEIARIIAFLASEDAAFMTGSVIIADGGGGIVDAGTLAFTS